MKNGRWVKVHEQGQANFEAKNNVMDVVVGTSRCQAEVVYTANTRTIEKAASWLFSYMGCSNAQRLFTRTAAEIQKKAEAATANGDERMEAEGEGWNCTIEMMEKGKFKVSLNWASEIEPVEIPQLKKKRGKKNDEAQPVEELNEAQSIEVPVKKSSKKTGKKRSKKNVEAAE